KSSAILNCMTLRKSAGQIIGTAVLIALAIVALRVATPAAQAASADLSKTYNNTAYGFELKMPSDFSAYPADASPDRDATGAPIGQAIVLQNASGAAVQIVITQDTRETPSNTLTVDDIEQSALYLDLSQAEP